MIVLRKLQTTLLWWIDKVFRDAEDFVECGRGSSEMGGLNVT